MSALTLQYAIQRLTNTQLTIALIGWAFIFYLHNRTLKKGEVSRLKESITKEIKDLFTWLDGAANKTCEQADGSSQKAYSELELEEELAGKITLIEFLISQINEYTHSSFLDPLWLVELRNIDTAQLISNGKVSQVDKLRQFDIIEKVETAYHEQALSSNLLKNLWVNNKDTILGAIAGLAIVALFAVLITLLDP